MPPTSPSITERPDPVTVVVITSDRRDELTRTLERLTALPEKPPIIVIDNASTDGSADQVADRFPSVTIIRSDRNLGAVGRNIGVTVARTPYVAFCDDDTWWDAGSLARAAEILDRHPQVAVLTASIIVEPDGRLDPICDEITASPLPRPDGVPGHPLISFLAGVSVVRRDAFLLAGGFSPKLWLGGEEELLASDLLRAGWQLTHVPELVAHHHPSTARDPHRRRRDGIRNTLWFTWLRRSLADAIVRTTRLLRTIPRDRVSAAALIEAIRGLPWVLRNRNPLPADLERLYRLLEADQVGGRNRRYVS